MGSPSEKWPFSIDLPSVDIRMGPLDKGFIADNLRSAFNPKANTFTGSITRGLRGMAQGAGDVAQGRVGLGVGKMFGGYLNTVTGGATEGLLPGEDKQLMMAEDAQAEAEAQYNADVAAREAARRKRIETRVSQEVALRKRQPGRSQTLLTSTPGANSLFPSGNNTLLTLGKSNG